LRTRNKIAALAATALGAGAIATGAVAASSGGGGADRAADLAAAINKQAGTSITADQVQAAMQDLLKTRLDKEVAAGRMTQAQEDAILKAAQNGTPPPFGRLMHFRGPRADVLTPVAKLLNLSVADLRSKLAGGSTLAQVAQAQGVSRADLLSTIKATISAKAPNVTGDDLDQLAAHIADDAHGPGAGPGPGRPWPGGGFGGRPPAGAYAP
jgi:hypothetical protein